MLEITGDEGSWLEKLTLTFPTTPLLQNTSIIEGKKTGHMFRERLYGIRNRNLLWLIRRGRQLMDNEDGEHTFWAQMEQGGSIPSQERRYNRHLSASDRDHLHRHLTRKNTTYVATVMSHKKPV